MRLLAETLRRAGLDVLETRQPGGTAARRRSCATSSSTATTSHRGPRRSCIAADKAHHVDTVIAPALEAGRVVVTDRYIDSAIAYQGAGRDLGSREVADIQLWAVAGLVPNLTVVLDIAPGPAGAAAETCTTAWRPRATTSTRRSGSTSSPSPRPSPTATSSSTPPWPPDEIHARVVARLRASGLALEVGA